MLGVTGWLAPHLWQRETSIAKELAPGTSTAAGGGGSPCCPSIAEVAPQRTREYFPLLSFHDGEGSATVAGCVACGGVSTGLSSTVSPGSEGVVPAASGLQTATAQVTAPAPVSTWVPTQVPVSQPTSQPPPRPRPAAPLPPPIQTVAVSPEAASSALQTLPAAPTPPPPAPPKTATAPLDAALLGRALLLALLALLSYVGVRPLRRWVTLTHLRRPLWRQSRSEEISNGWQWILVSLRDAGWEALPEERPRAFARRVAIAGVLDGATVLERARHGLRVTEADVQAMGAAARAVQSEVLGPLGPSARVVSWFRWPLV